MNEECNTFLPSEDTVKLLGRTYRYKNQIWCALSASGIEFSLTAKSCSITLEGDNMASPDSEAMHYARVGVYVDGELAADELMNESRKVIRTFTYQEKKTVTVRVIKLSEASDSTLGIVSIHTDADGITPTPQKDTKIEFIGDSITCGYGADGVLGDLYAASNENVSKSYAYLSAQAVNADYSMVSFSGYGIISGWSDDGTIQDQSLVPLYYTKLGNSYGKFAKELAPQSVEWEFNQFQPDLIVINLGTNDASYCGDREDRSKAYQKEYTNFLKLVRSKNEDAFLLCTLGIMGDVLYPYLEAAVEAYKKETGDSKIDTMHFTDQDPNDGYAVDYHPSPVSHQKAAEQLIPKLQEILHSAL